MKDLRSLPSVDQLLHLPECIEMIHRFGQTLVVDSLRQTLEEIRADKIKGLPDKQNILVIARGHCMDISQPTIQHVINATGVILHTNLGRAPLSRESIAAMEMAARGYSSLEYDLAVGSRGSRHLHCEKLLIRLTGAESAMVVNNNAAAVLLILSALFHKKKAAISRSQLVEIGGSFRIPDVMRQSGARLVEVGTTNQTHLQDYVTALDEGAAGILRVHSSNFKIIGFTDSPDFAEMVGAAHQAGAILVDDLGSGSLLETTEFGMLHEPMVQESVKAGADVISFSGDKLLGGPQAGIIVGKKALVDKLKKHPLARAIRADKLCLAGLAATLIHYLKNEAEEEIPVWRMIGQSSDVIKQRALFWQDQLGFGRVIPGESTVGGGSLPGETLPTWLLAIVSRSPDKMLKQLRNGYPAVIARIDKDQVVFDPRTVLIAEETDLLSILGSVFAQNRNSQ